MNASMRRFMDSKIYRNLLRLSNFICLYMGYLCSCILHRYCFCHKPFFLSIEPCNVCNLRCPQCPTGLHLYQRTRKTFDKSLLDGLLQKLEDSVSCIQFYFQGEPLLADELPEMVKLAKKYDMYCIVSTNAQTLDDKMAARLVDAGLDKIIVSMDGLTQDSYEKYRVGGNLERVLCGLQNLKKNKFLKGSKRPIIELQWLVLRSNEHEMNEVKRLYRRLGADRLVFKKAQFYDFATGNDMMPLNEHYSRYKKVAEGRWRLKGKLHNRCFRLWSGAVIDVEGNVRPCCFDKGGEYILGNLYHEDFMQVWKGETAVRFRHQVLSERGSIDICCNCTSP